jgi:hypothetical protein
MPTSGGTISELIRAFDWNQQRLHEDARVQDQIGRTVWDNRENSMQIFRVLEQDREIDFAIEIRTPSAATVVAQRR